MCFSATASFTAAAVLAGVGVATLKSASEPREIPFAAIPLLFAIQQFIEGVVWLTFTPDAAGLNAVMTNIYTFFSHVLWPIYIPIAAWLIEPRGSRRRRLLAFILIGLMVGLYLFYILVAYPVVARPVGGHVEYLSPHFFAAVTMTLYLLATTVSMLFSSHRTVAWFGMLALLSFAAAYYFYAVWLISVWCFFAGLLSAVVWLHFHPRRVALVA